MQKKFCKSDRDKDSLLILCTIYLKYYILGKFVGKDDAQEERKGNVKQV